MLSKCPERKLSRRFGASAVELSVCLTVRNKHRHWRQATYLLAYIGLRNNRPLYEHEYCARGAARKIATAARRRVAPRRSAPRPVWTKLLAPLFRATLCKERRLYNSLSNNSLQLLACKFTSKSATLPYVTTRENRESGVLEQLAYGIAYTDVWHLQLLYLRIRMPIYRCFSVGENNAINAMRWSSYIHCVTTIRRNSIRGMTHTHNTQGVPKTPVSLKHHIFGNILLLFFYPR